MVEKAATEKERGRTFHPERPGQRRGENSAYSRSREGVFGWNGKLLRGPVTRQRKPGSQRAGLCKNFRNPREPGSKSPRAEKRLASTEMQLSN